MSITGEKSLRKWRFSQQFFLLLLFGQQQNRPRTITRASSGSCSCLLGDSDSVTLCNEKRLFGNSSRVPTRKFPSSFPSSFSPQVDPVLHSHKAEHKAENPSFLLLLPLLFLLSAGVTVDNFPLDRAEFSLPIVSGKNSFLAVSPKLLTGAAPFLDFSQSSRSVAFVELGAGSRGQGRS